MGFEKIQQWKRHKSVLSKTLPIRVVCERCHVELPLGLVPGTVVLSKEDRLYIGDNPKAENCEL